MEDLGTSPRRTGDHLNKLIAYRKDALKYFQNLRIFKHNSSNMSLFSKDQQLRKIILRETSAQSSGVREHAQLLVEHESLDVLDSLVSLIITIQTSSPSSCSNLTHTNTVGFVVSFGFVDLAEKRL